MKTSGWLTAILILGISAAYADKPKSWPETMTAMRAKDAPSEGVTFGHWYRTQMMPCNDLMAELQVSRHYDPEAKDSSGKAVWTAAKSMKDGQVTSLKTANNNACYFHRKIVASQNCKQTFSFGSDDGILVWLNGKVILKQDVRRAAAPDQAVVDVDLKKGANTLTIKIFDAGGVCGIYFSAESGGNSDTKKMWADYPVQSDWVDQDSEGKFDYKTYRMKDRTADMEKLLIEKAVQRLGRAPEPCLKDLAELVSSDVSPDDPRWLALYEKICRQNRKAFLKPLLEKTKKIVFAKHHVFGARSGIFYITETEGCHAPSSLAIIDLTPELNGEFANESLLFDAQDGIVRDPEVSFDGRNLLFAWRRTRNTIRTVGVGSPAPETGNYQIYEMDLKTKKIRQMTDDETYGANFEPCYLANGDIVFSSARIVQHITCGWGDCSNLFIMNKDGKYQRRLGFDQTNTAFPTLLNDGRVIYLRRDYNDRGQSSAHALFVMNPDGTQQTEMYGNQTGTPNSFSHTRAIPGSHKLVTILGGYHTTQGGKLAIMDVSKGRQLADGLIQIPEGITPESGPGYNDRYGKQGTQYSNPYPLSETEFLVSINDTGNHKRGYKIYFMTADGKRELLTYDPTISCLQPYPVMARKRPAVRPAMADYTKDSGTVFLQDCYYGPAVEGVKRGTIKKIRVVEILYKPVTIGAGMGRGPGGAWHTVTTSGHPLGSFDAKKILGDATVYEDGSAMFKVPARVPLYFQLLDERNRVVQTMRSWATLMPGEHFSCVGCHENKGSTPIDGKVSYRPQAMLAGAEELKSFHGDTEGFRYIKHVQPVFDKHCISCHSFESKDDKAKTLILTKEPMVHDPDAKKVWALSYYNLTKPRPGPNPEDFATRGKIWNRGGSAKEDEPNKYIKWYTRFETMGPKPPYRAGAVASPMTKLLEEGHYGVKLTQAEFDKLYAWLDLNIPYCGSYNESNTWTSEEIDYWNQRMAERRRNEEIEQKNITQFIKDGQP